MPTEVWLRNPNNYIREVVEAGAYLVAWDRGQLVKSKTDIVAHSEAYFGKTYPWRAMAIGIQGAAEYRSGDEFFKPTAVYPVWEYGDEMAILEELLSNPIGEDSTMCADTSIPGDERPVLGQEHRVVIVNLPNLAAGPGRKFLSQLKDLQEEYPSAIIHLHGLYAFKMMFGMNFKSVDFDARTDAQKGNVYLPLGSKVTFEMAGDKSNVHQLTILGYRPVDLKDPKVRCIFNIKSAMWAAEHYHNLSPWRTRPSSEPVDTTSSDANFKAPTKGAEVRAKAAPGDKVTCSTCSLAGKCTSYRDGSVCTLPNAPTRTLASRFGTRDADLIVDGLIQLQELSARRLERGIAIEESVGDIDPEVTKLITQVFKQGSEVAKLIDPNLRGGARVQVNVGGSGTASIGSLNPGQAVAGVIRELEGRGFKREEITPQMVADFVKGMGSPDDMQRVIEAPKVIEADVVDAEVVD